MTTCSLVPRSFLISNIFSALITVVASAHEAARAWEDVSWVLFSVCIGYLRKLWAGRYPVK